MKYSFKERNDWFVKFFYIINHTFPLRYRIIEMFVCPCCAYPTLTEKDAHEICFMCGWQDDGQDDADADEVMGGPNYELSLTAARTNFEKDQTSYNINSKKYKDQIEHHEQRRNDCKVLIPKFESLINVTNPEASHKKWQEIFRIEHQRWLDHYNGLSEEEKHFIDHYYDDYF